MAGRVLLIDDDPKVLRLLEATLRLKSYDVVKMESGVAALDWLKLDLPDLIISDIMMPDLDGYDFLRRVRATTKATQVPFIFLSARSEPDDVVRGLRLGADEFLRKPFSIDELLVRVERVLERNAKEPEDPLGRGVFDGDLAHLPLADVLRMLCVQRKTGLLVIDPKTTKGSGSLQLLEGQVVHGEFGALEGEAALCQMLLHDTGRFSFRPGEERPQRSIEVQTLPLLMEAFRLMDVGVLRRIDPHNLVAAATLARLIQIRRDEVGPLPLIDEIEEPSRPRGLEGLALRLTKGRPPPGTSQEVEIDDGSLNEPDFHETVQLDGREYLVDEEIPSLVDLSSNELEAARAITESPEDETDFGSAEIGPDTWERARVLRDEDADPDDSVGLDSIEMAPLIGTGEFERLEAELGIRREPSESAPPPVHDLSAVDVDLDDLEDLPATTQVSELRPEGSIILQAAPEAEPETDVDGEETGISLVDDTVYEVPVVQKEAGTDELMAVYERLKVVASKDLGSRDVMLGTRSGRVIASAIRDESRRGTVAAFSAQAIAFASADASGQHFAVLDAGDLHVIVLEVDHLRLFTILFDRKPEPPKVLDALRPELLRWRST